MYDQFYRLTGRPFQLAPDPEFYFESLTHRKALSYLGYGLAQGEGFIVITGEVGAGKSTLAAHLVASIDRSQLTVAQIVTSGLDGGELVRLVAQSFGVVPPQGASGYDKPAALGLIEAFLQDEARAGRRCLLIVDEAQNLTAPALEELRMLSNFQLGAHPLLQIVLLGQPEFRALIEGPGGLEQLRQRIIATHHLDAMEPEEVGPYVEHRLARVGWTGRPRFAAGVFARLAEASGAVPRRINQLANRLLILGEVEQAEVIDLAMLEDVIADLAGETGNPAPAVVAAPVEAPVAPVAGPDPVAAVRAELEAALAARDQQIAELQQAVMELAATAQAAPPPPAEPVQVADSEPVLAALVELTRRIEALETRTSDQNEAIRHVLTMLIEWLESENAPARAA